MNQLNPVLLCVDDEEANLKLLEKLLGHQGYTVVSAGNGKDALLKIKSQAIDLVLLDIIMPGMDGFEVCRQIKEDQKLRSIPVIMVTTLSDKKDRIRGIEAGAEEFLSKPFDINEVLARIKILLKMKALDDERKHMEAELQKSHAELEDKVRERTTELADANKKLKADIIKREQIEETLRKSEENFRLSLEDSPLGVRIATAKGETIYTNKAILDIYGYANVAELNKIPIKERYTPQSYAEFQIRKKAREDGDFGPSVYEINIIRKNGEIRHLQVLRQEAFWNGTMQFQVIYQDITERIQAKEEIQRQLTEKEILIKEVHHRIKNNIASIGGLLSLHMQSVTNPEAVAVLQDAIGRVTSMRILYDKLLLGEDYKDISVKIYLNDLIDTIIAIFPDHAKIKLEKQIADFHLDENRLFPLGCIVNELLTNKMKYAFINKNAGSIKISLKKVKNHVTLTMQDNGHKLPDGFDINESKGLGLTLVKMLSQQLDGSFSMKKQAGTMCKIEFDV